MESLVMNYSDEEDMLPPEDRIESNHFTSRTALQEIVEIPKSPKNILGTFFGFPVARSPCDLKDAVNNTNESHRNQMEDDDTIVVVSDEDDSNCDTNTNDVVSSIIICKVETAADDQDYGVLCSSRAKATLPISSRSFLEDETNTEMAVDFENSECQNGSHHIIHKECEESHKEKSTVATFPISSSSLVRQGVDLDNRENHSAVSPIGDKENESDRDAPTATFATIPVSSNSLVVQKADTATAIDREKFNASSIGHKEDEEFDKGNSTAVTSPISPTPLVGYGTGTESTEDSNNCENASVAPINSDKEDEDNSTAATLPIIPTATLVDHGDDSETAKDLHNRDKEYEIIDQENSVAVTSPLASSPSSGQGAQKETAMDWIQKDWDNSDTEDENSGKGNSTAATSPISSTHLVGDGADAGTTMDSNENHSSNEEDEEIDEDNSTAATLPISTRSLVGPAANTERDIDSDKSDLEDEKSVKGNSLAATSPISPAPVHDDGDGTYTETAMDADNRENRSVSPISDTEGEENDKEKSTAATLPGSTRPLVGQAINAETMTESDYSENSGKGNSTAVTSPISSTHLVGHGADAETTMDSNENLSNEGDEKSDEVDSSAATLPTASTPLVGLAADTEGDMDSENSDTEDEKSEKENSIAATSPIPPAFLGGDGDGSDTEAEVDSDNSENRSVSSMSHPEDEENDKQKSTADATLPGSTRSLVGQAVNAETATDSDYIENYSESSLSDKEDEESDKENSTAKVKNSLDSSNEPSVGQFETGSRDASSSSQKCHKPPTFKCNLCSYSSTIRFGLKRHMLTHSENLDLDKINCAHCPFETKSKKSLYNHWLVTHKRSKCTNCDTFVTAHLKKDHLLKCKPKKNILECKECQYATIYEKMFVKHQMECGNKRHSIKRQSEESEDQGGKLEKSKQRAEINEHSKHLYRCEYCSYSTEKPSNLKAHILVHTVSNSPMYQCTKCDFISTMKSLTLHLKVAHNTKFKDANVTPESQQLRRCDFCSYTTKNVLELKKHLPLHTVYNKRIYRCPKCDYKSTKLNYSKHVKTAHKIKSKNTSPLAKTEGLKKCDFCSHTTKRNDDLKKHRQLHIVRNEPIVSCTKCDYKAPKITLTFHYNNVHGFLKKERQMQVYTCKFCSHTSKREDAAKKHLLLHTVHNRQIYRCPKCDYKSTKKNITKHVKTVHKIEPKNFKFLAKTKGLKTATKFSHNLIRHRQLHTVRNKSIVSCSKCDYKAPRVDLFHHYKNVHGSLKQKKQMNKEEKAKPALTCKFCSHTSKHEHNARKHLLLHTVYNRPIYHCPTCDYKSTEMNLANHVKTVHKIKSIDISSLEKAEPSYSTCKFCSHTPKNEDALKKHLLLHTVHNRPIYHCPSCDYKSTEMNLAKHVRTVHKIGFIDISSLEKAEQVYTCKFCSYTTKYEDSLKKHLLFHTVHNKPIYQCPKCNYNSFKLNVAKHVKAVHKIQSIDINSLKKPEQVYTCKFCSYTTKYEDCVKRHLPLHTVHNQHIYQCPKCDYKAFKMNLAKHVKAVHKIKFSNSWDKAEQGYTCKFCSLTTTREDSMNKHLVLHTVHNRPIYHCSKCHYKSTKLSLMKHIKAVHKIQTIDINSLKKTEGLKQCEFCSYSTTFESSMIEHRQLHNADGLLTDNAYQLGKTDEVHACNFCSFIAKSEPNLKSHLLLHTVHNRPIHSCDNCDYKSTKHNLSRHSCNHTGKQVVTLGKKNTQKAMTEDEQKSSKKVNKEFDTNENKGERPHTKTRQQLAYPEYSCELCSFSTEFEANLSKHLQMHKVQDIHKEKPEYSCDFCSFTTPIEKRLNDHLDIHTELNEPLHSCSQCNYRSTKLDVARHSRTHREEQRTSNQSNRRDLDTSEIEAEDTLKRSPKLVSMIKTNEQLEQPQYICNFCSFTTKFEPSLIRHLRLHPERNEQICDDKSTKRPLRQHSHIHRGEQMAAPERKSPRNASQEDTQKTVPPLKRRKLSNEADTSENEGEEYVEQAMTRTNEELPHPKYGCDLCSFTTNFEGNLERHLRFHEEQNEQIYSCSHCEYKSTKSNIAIHSSTVHGITFGSGKRMYNCKVCSFSSEVRFIFEQHVQSHTDHEECINNSRVQLQNVTTHSRIVHREKLVFEQQNEEKEVTIHRCQLCSFTTMFNGNLLRHLRSHSEDHEPRCKKIAKHSVTVQKSITKVDMAIYNCEFCSFTTDLAEAFKQHYRLHEINRAAVKTETPLRSNKRKPEDWEKPTKTSKRSRVDQLPEINGSSDSSDSFQVTHGANNVIYVCEICDYTTNHKQNLISHKLTHLSTKTFEGDSLSSAQANCRTPPSNPSAKRGYFKCTTCKRCFTSSYAYRVHVCEEDTDEYTVHVKGDSVTFKCRKCSYQTIAKQSIKRHCRTTFHA